MPPPHAALQLLYSLQPPVQSSEAQPSAAAIFAGAAVRDVQDLQFFELLRRKIERSSAFGMHELTDLVEL